MRRRCVDQARRISHGTCTSLDGPYGNFAGRDASRGMAKQSFDEGLSGVFVLRLTAIDRHVPDMLTPIDQPLDKLEDLTPSEMCVTICSLLVTLVITFLSSENMNGMLTLIPISMVSRGISRMD